MKKLLLIVLAAALILAGCAKKEEAGVIKIGVGGAHTGDLASYGIPSVRAAELVVEMFNEKGGIHGKKIQLVIEDDQCKPEIAINTASKLVGENVIAVQGHICSGATRAALGIYKDSNIVTVSPSATNPPLTQSGEYPNFFRTIAPDDAQAMTAVDFIKGSLGLKKIAILHDRGDYGRGFAELCKEAAEAAGIEVVLFDGVNPGSPDYSAVVIRVGNANPEGVIWGGYHPEASKIVQQMRDRGIDIPFIGPDGVKDATFIEVAGRYSEGVYATGPIDTSTNPMTIKAIADHVKKYGEEPGAFFLNAYAATIAILRAIEIGGEDYKSITNALRDNVFDTPLGKISFDKIGDATGIGFSVYQVKNGVYVGVQ